MHVVQRATIARGNLLTFWQFSSSNVCPWSRPWTSIEICPRDDCSVWACTQRISLLVDMVLFVGVFVILFACQKIVCLLKNLGSFNVQNRQILVLLSNWFWGWIQTWMTICIEDSIHSRDYNYWAWTTIEICIQKDDISYTGAWSTIRESAKTTQKSVSTLAKNQQLFSYGTETLFGQGYPW